MRSFLLPGIVFSSALTPITLVQAQSIDELFRQGNAAQAVGDYETAESIFRQVLRQDPDNAAAYSNLGIALYAQGRYEEAEAAFREVLRLAPDDAITYYNLGIALADQGHLAEAEAAFRESLRLDPDNAITYYNLGIALADQGHLAEAEAAFRESLRLDPDDVDTYIDLTSVLYEQGLLEDAEAEASYQEALRLDPDNVTAYSNLGSTLYGQGRLAEAEAAFREALRLDPDDVPAYYNLGITLYDQGRLAEAEAAFREALRLDPDFPFPLNALGYLYQTQARYAEAIELYDRALAIDPEFVVAQNNLAETERLLNLQDNPVPTRVDDLAWLPANEPLLPVLRAVVRVVTTTSTGIEYGTGVVVQREGSRIWVLTNRHVVTDGLLGSVADDEQRAQRQAAPLSDEVSVDFFSEPPAGRTWLRLEATVIDATGPRDELDLALLLIEDAPDDIQPLTIGDSDQLARRTDLTVIGHPITDLPWTVDSGLLSNRDDIRLQVSQASFGPRSSGGPILNEQNQIVGIIFEAIDTRATGTSSGFGLAYRVEYIEPTLRQWGML